MFTEEKERVLRLQEGKGEPSHRWAEDCQNRCLCEAELNAPSLSSVFYSSILRREPHEEDIQPLWVCVVCHLSDILICDRASRAELWHWLFLISDLSPRHQRTSATEMTFLRESEFARTQAIPQHHWL